MTRRSAPTSSGFSIRIGIPVLTPGPIVRHSASRYRSASSSNWLPSGGTTEETQTESISRRTSRRARRAGDPLGQLVAGRPERVWKRQCSTRRSPSKAPRWVWVLPTSTASSIRCDYRDAAGRGSDDGHEEPAESRTRSSTASETRRRASPGRWLRAIGLALSGQAHAQAFGHRHGRTRRSTCPPGAADRLDDEIIESADGRDPRRPRVSAPSRRAEGSSCSPSGPTRGRRRDRPGFWNEPRLDQLVSAPVEGDALHARLAPGRDGDADARVQGHPLQAPRPGRGALQRHPARARLSRQHRAGDERRRRRRPRARARSPASWSACSPSRPSSRPTPRSEPRSKRPSAGGTRSCSTRSARSSSGRSSSGRARSAATWRAPSWGCPSAWRLRSRR